MDIQISGLLVAGAICFGSVVGWMTHCVLQSAQEMTAQWLGAVLGVIGGGAVTAVFEDKELFASYCIGLAIFFFVRSLLAAFDIGGFLTREMKRDEDREEARRQARAAAREKREQLAKRHDARLQDGAVDS